MLTFQTTDCTSNTKPEETRLFHPIGDKALPAARDSNEVAPV